jgi:hypothetical protein
MIRTRSALLAAAPLALALALAGCHRNQAQTGQAFYPATTLPPLPASLPLSTAPVTGPLMPAPPVTELPRARPIEEGYVPPDEDYAWIDRADMLFDTIGDAPPDYGFDYDGVEPWAWETTDGYELIAEPIDDGYRYYYYEPGDDAPFLVRDPYYSYGYGDGRLVAVYAGGRLLGQAEAARQADAAARYWARAQGLRGADQALDRRPVSAFLWAQQRPLVAQARQQWTLARAQDPAWQQWRARQPNGPAVARLQAEHQVRAGAAQRFAQWQRAGLNGPAPRLYPAGAVRHSSEPIMRPGRPTLFGPPQPDARPDGRQASFASRTPGLPRVQAAPAMAGRAAFAQARAPQAALRAQEAGPRAGRVAFRNAAPERIAASARQERVAATRFQRPAAAARMSVRREAAFAQRPVRVQARAAQMQAHRPAFAPRQIREARAAPIQARREFPQFQAQRQVRMAPVQARAPARVMEMQARQQSRMAFRAPPPQMRAAPAPHAAPAPRQAAPHGGGGGGGGGGGHDHGHGH